MQHVPNEKKFLNDLTRLEGANGFTLVEILVAVTIFSFAVLGLGIGTVTIARTNADSHLQATAINAAQGRLEELRGTNGITLTALAAACTAFTSSGCSDSIYASEKSFSRSWRFVANSPVAGVNRIDVKVDWTDHANRSVTFSAAVPQ